MANSALIVAQKYWPDVTKVVDAKRPLNVEVQRQDLRRARPKDPAKCVMSVACVREHGLDGALIFRSKAYLKSGTTATRYDVTDAIVKEIVPHDRFGVKGFEPGTYRLVPVNPSARLGARVRPGARERSAKTKRRPMHVTKGLRPHA